MIDIKYERAYCEILEILKYIPIEDYNKIPKEKIKIFEKYAGKNYKFIYHPSKTLDENNVSKLTKGIIAILYRDYWASSKQREKLIACQEYKRIQIESEKKEKYNSDDIFKSNDYINNYQSYNKDVNSNNLPIEIEENNIFIKVIIYLKKILHIDD